MVPIGARLRLSSPSRDPMAALTDPSSIGSPWPLGSSQGYPGAVCGNISEERIGDPESLRYARPIDLTRTAGSEASRHLTGTVLDLLRPHLDRKRPLGPTGLQTAQESTAAILGGLIRPGLRGRPVTAPRRPGASLWRHSLVGQRAFWAKADAMAAAGLLGTKAGIKVPDTWFDVTTFGGIGAAWWPTPRLLALAAAHGIMVETLATDWPISQAAEEQRVALSHEDVVVVRAIEGERAAALPVGQRETAVELRSRVVRLNAAVGAANIRGCLAPAFRRIFHGDLRLEGRHYALGTNNVQTMPPAERAAVTIGGEAVVELDIRASQLSVFLGLTTGALPSGDPYDVGGVPRGAAKAWTTMTFGAGKSAVRWSDRTPENARGVPCSAVRDAMLRTYPTLAAIDAVLPADLRAKLPPDKLAWAAGRFLVGVEAAIISDAMDAVLQAGGVPLPVHDALIVAERWRPLAKAVMARAFVTRTGVIPAVR